MTSPQGFLLQQMEESYKRSAHSAQVIYDLANAVTQDMHEQTTALLFAFVITAISARRPGVELDDLKQDALSVLNVLWDTVVESGEAVGLKV